jgi:hypothetical protein
MDQEFYTQQALRARDLAEKADPFTRKLFWLLPPRLGIAPRGGGSSVSFPDFSRRWVRFACPHQACLMHLFALRYELVSGNAAAGVRRRPLHRCRRLPAIIVFAASTPGC